MNTPDRTPATPPTPDPLVQKVYRLFGRDTLVVPVRNGDFVNRAHTDFTLEQSRDPAYQALLAASNLAVACGSQSGNLVAMRFPEEHARTEFLRRNRALRKTVLTSFENNFYVWLRVLDWRAGNYVHPFFGWAAEGFIMVADREQNSVYHFDTDNPVATVSFKRIIWHFDAKIIGPLGAKPCKKTRVKRGPKPRLPADEQIIAIFRAAYKDLYFDPPSKRFYVKLENGRINPLYLEEVKQLLHGALPILAKYGIEGAQDSPAGNERRLSRLVSLLKIVAARRCARAIEMPGAPSQEPISYFDAFINGRLNQAEGNALTVDEIYAAYRGFCLEHGYLQLTEAQFQRCLGRAIQSRFGLGQSHDIAREDRAKRGFRRLGIETNDGHSGTFPDTTDTSFSQ